ncbi:MAG TPA: hypothetical protein VFQ68_27900 [Streptosporangiaceae bacterium]|nr:hypothetical protein [Streptosporangiaceae bacterium]
MSDRVPTPGDADDSPGSELEVADTDEFAKMRACDARTTAPGRRGGS